MELLRSPWSSEFDALLSQASSALTLCAPYIGRGPCERVKARVKEVADPRFKLTIVTDLRRENILSGATDVFALQTIVEAFPETAIRFLPSLHAKVYIADDKRAIVTSGNLTDSGLLRNLEYGVLFTKPTEVRVIQRDVLEFAALGSPISRDQLETLATIVADLRDLGRAAELELKSRIRREFERRLREADVEILRARAGGRTAHAIFAEAILWLLRKHSMITAEINEAIQQIHPDLCDDSVDLVIDGQHFGKRWKHGVRTAQVFLRRRGDIYLEDRHWHLTTQ